MATAPKVRILLVTDGRTTLERPDAGTVAGLPATYDVWDITRLHRLAEAGRAEQTILVFTSDNGGERWSKNWPLVGEKDDLAEGGIRVPLFLRWLAAAPGGQVTGHPVHTLDLTATLIDAGGTVPDERYPLDGVNLLPWLVDGADFPEHDLFWRTSNQGRAPRPAQVPVRPPGPVRAGRNWPRRSGPFHLLYDVTVDGREQADIADHHPQLLDDLRATWTRIDAELLPFPPEHLGLPRRRLSTASRTELV